MAHARPLSSDNLVEVLEKAVQHPDKVVPEVAESVTTSVDAMTVSVKKQARCSSHPAHAADSSIAHLILILSSRRHLINSPTSACIALNLGAALFGSNQVRMPPWVRWAVTRGRSPASCLPAGGHQIRRGHPITRRHVGPALWHRSTVLCTKCSAGVQECRPQTSLR